MFNVSSKTTFTSLLLCMMARHVLSADVAVEPFAMPQLLRASCALTPEHAPSAPSAPLMLPESAAFALRAPKEDDHHTQNTAGYTSEFSERRLEKRRSGRSCAFADELNVRTPLAEFAEHPNSLSSCVDAPCGYPTSASSSSDAPHGYPSPPVAAVRTPYGAPLALAPCGPWSESEVFDTPVFDDFTWNESEVFGALVGHAFDMF